MENSAEITLRAAKESDLDDVISLLIDTDLHIDGVHENIKNFVIAIAGDSVVGCCGAEAYQFAGVIRSVAVHPDFQRKGIGRKLVRQILDRLSSRGLREFYVVPGAAEEFFRKRGFKPCDRDEVHPQIVGSTEFTVVPEDACVMRLQMLT